MKKVIVILALMMLIVAGCAQQKPAETPKEEKQVDKKPAESKQVAVNETPREEQKKENASIKEIDENFLNDDLDDGLGDLQMIKSLNLSQELQ